MTRGCWAGQEGLRRCGRAARGAATSVRGSRRRRHARVVGGRPQGQSRCTSLFASMLAALLDCVRACAWPCCVLALACAACVCRRVPCLLHVQDMVQQVMQASGEGSCAQGAVCMCAKRCLQAAERPTPRDTRWARNTRRQKCVSASTKRGRVGQIASLDVAARASKRVAACVSKRSPEGLQAGAEGRRAGRALTSAAPPSILAWSVRPSHCGAFVVAKVASLVVALFASSVLSCPSLSRPPSLLHHCECVHAHVPQNAYPRAHTNTHTHTWGRMGLVLATAGGNADRCEGLGAARARL